jgi:membrane fusion protein, multidrug efflux system
VARTVRNSMLWCLGLVACAAEAAAPLPSSDVARSEAVVAEASRPGYVGVVLAGAAVDVAPTRAGEVLAVHVRVGDPVIPGQSLATLDDGDARGALRMAQARLDALHSEIAVADLEVAQAARRVAAERRLAASGASSEHALEEAEFAATRTIAERRAARAAHVEQRAVVEQRRRELGETSIVAPFAGSVARLYREAGAAVGPSMPIARIVGTQGVRVRFAMPPDEARRLAIDDALRVEVETLAEPVAARVRQIAAHVDAASRLVIVEGEIGDPAAQLHPGLGARVWVES